MDLRSIQKPLRDAYRADPEEAKITLTATGKQAAEAVSCSIDIGRAVYAAQAHAGVGGPGTGPCSGDLLLAALAACAQLTCQMVATASGIETNSIEVTVEGDLDLRGTLGLSPDAQVGFEKIRLNYAIDAPEATPEQIEALKEKSEKYCVVMQTLLNPPPVSRQWQIA